MTSPLPSPANRTSAAQPAPSQDPIGALMLRQRREVVGVGKPREAFAQGEKVTDLGEIARILQGCMQADDENDDLVVELLMLESLMKSLPLQSEELLEALGDLGDEVREGLILPNMINIAALRQRTQRIRQHIGHVASRVSAALVLFLTGLPLFVQPAAAADEERGYAVAAAPVVRVIDSATGQGMGGVQIKTMEERLLGVTDGQGQATLGEGYMETDLLSLEKDGYEMYLLDRTQLSSRNIVSMKPNAGGASMAQAPGASGASAVTAPRRPSATVKPPTALKAPTPPNMAHADGHAPVVTAPKLPARPAAPTIKLPPRPRPKAADLHARVTAPAAPVVRPGQPGIAGGEPMAMAPSPELHLPVRPAAPKHMAAAPHKPAMHAPKAPARVAAAPSAAHEATINLPARPRVPAMGHASTMEATPREQPHVAIPRRMPRPRVEAAAGGTYYRVQPGDSLSKIAKRTLGSTRRWPELFAANRRSISNPRFIRVGQTLILPSHDAPAAGATYVVRPGDCLFNIASSQLGAGSKWKSIWQLNKDRIRDVRFIYPGQRLTLPLA